MSLTTWLLCWYAVGVLTCMYLWQSNRNADLKMGDLVAFFFIGLGGPLVILLGWLGPKIPTDWLDIILIRR